MDLRQVSMTEIDDMERWLYLGHVSSDARRFDLVKDERAILKEAARLGSQHAEDEDPGEKTPRGSHVRNADGKITGIHHVYAQMAENNLLVSLLMDADNNDKASCVAANCLPVGLIRSMSDRAELK